MFENELKFEIKDYDKFKKVAKEKDICFDKGIKQKDCVWIMKNSDGMNLVSGEPIVRTREEGDKICLTLKKELKQGCFEEHEILVSEIFETDKILENLGMRKLVTIEKVRQLANIDEFSLYLDVVNLLGSFFEVEVLTEAEDCEAKDRILQFVKQFGLSEDDIVENTYNTLLCRKFGLR